MSGMAAKGLRVLAVAGVNSHPTRRPRRWRAAREMEKLCHNDLTPCGLLLGLADPTATAASCSPISPTQE